MRGEKSSARDAVGQMFAVGMSGTEPDYYIEIVRKRNIGGVVLFGYNVESGDQTKQLTDSLQQLSMTAKHFPNHGPALEDSHFA